jgi:hypothetical protein
MGKANFGSTVVELMPHYSKVQCGSPAAVSGIGREKAAKKPFLVKAVNLQLLLLFMAKTVNFSKPGANPIKRFTAIIYRFSL